MRTKLSDWTVGESVRLISAHTIGQPPLPMVVVEIGRKYLVIGRTIDSKAGNFKFQYVDSKLQCVGVYCHEVYSVEDYKNIMEYNRIHEAAENELKAARKLDYTEMNIFRLGKILEGLQSLNGKAIDEVL